MSERRGFEGWADMVVAAAELRAELRPGRGLVSRASLESVVAGLPEGDRARMRAAVLLANGYGR